MSAATRRTSRQDIQHILNEISQVIHDSPPSPTSSKNSSFLKKEEPISRYSGISGDTRSKYSEDSGISSLRTVPESDLTRRLGGERRAPLSETNSSRDTYASSLGRDRDVPSTATNSKYSSASSSIIPRSADISLSKDRISDTRDFRDPPPPIRYRADDDLGLGRMSLDPGFAGRSMDSPNRPGDRDSLIDMRAQHLRNIVKSHEKDSGSYPLRYDRDGGREVERDRDWDRDRDRDSRPLRLLRDEMPPGRSGGGVGRREQRDEPSEWRGDGPRGGYPPYSPQGGRDRDFDDDPRRGNPRVPTRGGGGGNWEDSGRRGRDGGWQGGARRPDPRYDEPEWERDDRRRDDRWDDRDDRRDEYDDRWEGRGGMPPQRDRWDSGGYLEDEEVVHTDVVLADDYDDQNYDDDPYYDGIDEYDDDYGFMVASENDLTEAKVAYFHGILGEGRDPRDGGFPEDNRGPGYQRPMGRGGPPGGPPPPHMRPRRPGMGRGGPGGPPYMQPNGGFPMIEGGNDDGIVAGNGLAMPAWLDSMQPPAGAPPGADRGPMPLLAGKPHPMARFMINGQITLATMPPNPNITPVRIMEHVFLGDYHSSANRDGLLGLGIKAIVNCTTEIACHFPGVFKYNRVAVDDLPTVNIKQHFKSALNFIDQAYEHGDNVLVHCLAGRARSATIVLVFLMVRMRLNLRQAYELTKAKKPDIRPNFGFWNQLIALEKEVFGRNTMRMEKGVVIPIGPALPPPGGR